MSARPPKLPGESHDAYCERSWSTEAQAIRDRLCTTRLPCWKPQCESRGTWLLTRDWPRAATSSCAKHRLQLMRKGWDDFPWKDIADSPTTWLEYLRGNVANGYSGPVAEAIDFLRRHGVIR